MASRQLWRRDDGGDFCRATRAPAEPLCVARRPWSRSIVTTASPLLGLSGRAPGCRTSCAGIGRGSRSSLTTSRRWCRGPGACHCGRGPCRAGAITRPSLDRWRSLSRHAAGARAQALPPADAGRSRLEQVCGVDGDCGAGYWASTPSRSRTPSCARCGRRSATSRLADVRRAIADGERLRRGEARRGGTERARAGAVSPVLGGGGEAGRVQERRRT